MQTELFDLRNLSRRKAAGPNIRKRPAHWRRPTLAEFTRQIEDEFGSTVDLGQLRLAGISDHEAIGPATIRALCAELGIPPEDFGVDA